MRIDLVFPALPPALDGIGDHTALLAQTLRHAGCDVRIHTAEPDPLPIPDVPVTTDFTISPPSGIRALRDAVVTDPPDWLFVQFNQFSYGRYGFNPWLPLTLRRIRREAPEIRIAWMAHEDFVPVINWKFALMTLWQRWQFWMLGKLADQIFFSIDPWVRQYSAWFPNTPVAHLPVGSNIPHLNCPKPDARRQLDLPTDAFVAGIFGTLTGGTRQTDLIAHTMRALRADDPNMHVLYIGPHGEELRDDLPDLPFHDAGRLPADRVSVGLTAMDLHVTPFVDGLSTRRGSAMASLQHGVATLSTDGPLTDQMLRDVNGNAVALSPPDAPDTFVDTALQLRHNAERRTALAQAGQSFYNTHFSGDATARRLLDALQSSATTSS